VLTVTVLLDGVRRSVAWRGPDELMGDPEVILLARAVVAAGQIVQATPTSNGRPATLVDPFVAMLTLSEVFGGLGAVAAVEVGGHVPPLPPEEQARPVLIC
jgi:hypothetical protein